MSPRRKPQPISLKLTEELEQALERLSRERNLSKAAVIREALAAYVAKGRASATAAAGNIVGSLDGPRDLSTARRHMSGFGE